MVMKYGVFNWSLKMVIRNGHFKCYPHVRDVYMIMSCGSLYFIPPKLRNLCCLALSYLVLSWHQRVFFDLGLRAVRSTLFDARTRPHMTAQWNMSMAIVNGLYKESSQMVMTNDHKKWSLQMINKYGHFKWSFYTVIYET